MDSAKQRPEPAPAAAAAATNSATNASTSYANFRYVSVDAYTIEELRVLETRLFDAVSSTAALILRLLATAEPPVNIQVDNFNVDDCIVKFGDRFQLSMLKGYVSLQTIVTIAHQAMVDNTDLCKPSLFPRRTPEVTRDHILTHSNHSRINRGVRVPLANYTTTLEHPLELGIIGKEREHGGASQTTPAAAAAAATAVPPQSKQIKPKSPPLYLTDLAQATASCANIVLNYERHLMRTMASLARSLAVDRTQCGPNVSIHHPKIVDRIVTYVREMLTYFTFLDQEARAVVSRLVSSYRTNATANDASDASSAAAANTTSTTTEHVARKWSSDPLRTGAFPAQINRANPGVVFVTDISALMDGPVKGHSSSKHGQPIKINASHSDSLASTLTGKRPAVYVKRHAKHSAAATGATATSNPGVVEPPASTSSAVTAE